MDAKYLNDLSASLPGGKRAPQYRRKRTNTIPYDRFFENEVKRFSAAENNFSRQSKILSRYGFKFAFRTMFSMQF